jgi:hypothetical protein
LVSAHTEFQDHRPGLRHVAMDALGMLLVMMVTAAGM